MLDRTLSANTQTFLDAFGAALRQGEIQKAVLSQPRAGTAMREPKTDQQIELIGTCSKTVLSGPDLSDHFPLLKSQAGIDIYFCDPQSPWQRGSNGNTNSLLRGVVAWMVVMLIPPWFICFRML